jgi:hypothetical protein
MKIKPGDKKVRTLDGHVIFFKHNAPESSATALNKVLPNLTALHQIKIMFFGTQEQFDLGRSAGVIATVPLTVRADAIYKMLRCLKKINNEAYIDIEIRDSMEFRNELTGTRDRLLNPENMTVVTDESLQRLEATETSRIVNTINLDIEDENVDVTDASSEGLDSNKKLSYAAGGAVFLNNLTVDPLPGEENAVAAANADVLQCVYNELFSHCPHPVVQAPPPNLLLPIPESPLDTAAAAAAAPVPPSNSAPPIHSSSDKNWPLTVTMLHM